MTYNADGLRKKRAQAAANLLYLWDGQAEVWSNAGGGDIESLHKPGVFGDLVYQFWHRTATPVFYLYDALGSAIMRLNGANLPLTSSVFDAYGEQLSGTAPLNAWVARYGYYLEASLGLYCVGQRWYSWTLGVWISEDRLGFVDGPNLYQYVGGNPVNAIDPSGLFIFPSGSRCKECGIITYDNFDETLAVHFKCAALALAEEARHGLNCSCDGMIVPMGGTGLGNAIALANKKGCCIRSLDIIDHASLQFEQAVGPKFGKLSDKDIDNLCNVMCEGSHVMLWGCGCGAYGGQATPKRILARCLKVKSISACAERGMMTPATGGFFSECGSQKPFCENNSLVTFTRQ